MYGLLDPYDTAEIRKTLEESGRTKPPTAMSEIQAGPIMLEHAAIRAPRWVSCIHMRQLRTDSLGHRLCNDGCIWSSDQGAYIACYQHVGVQRV